MQQKEYDILIVGGGLVGASLACAFKHLPLRIGVIEASAFDPDSPVVQPSYDERSIALAWGSRVIFESLGLWSQMAAAATAITDIHVSDRGHFGFTRMDASSHQVDALGYVVVSREMGKVLTSAMAACDNVDVICPATLSAMEVNEQQASVTLQQDGKETVLHARLVVGADGATSVVRDLLGIDTTVWDYGQTAIITNLSPSRAHQGIAYERFTSNGPMAMLPLSEGRCALVWTVPSDTAEEIGGLADEEFLAGVQEQFGYRLGKISRVGKRYAYPLRMVRANEQVRPRVALIGNAAHTLHPVAGQGFNLGLRDITTLAQVVADAHADGRDPGALASLQAYADWRKQDQRRVIRFTDSMVRAFSNDFLPLVLARNVGLVLADVLPPLKHTLTRRAMGLHGKLPRLARGLPL